MCDVTLRHRVAGWIRSGAGEKARAGLRKIDVRANRRRRRRVLEAEIAEKVRSRLLREQRKAAAMTLTAVARHVPVTASQRRVLGELEAFLARQTRARLAIIGPEASLLTDVLTERFPDVRIVEISGPHDLSERHVRLAANGPYDALLVTGPREDPAELLSNVLFHLRRGGLLAIADLDLAQPAPQGVLPLLLRLTTLRANRSTAADAGVGGDEKMLVRSVRRVVIGDDFVVVENRTSSLAKMREEEMSALLQRVEPGMGSVLCGVEAQHFTPSSAVHDHGGDRTARVRDEIAVPSLELREYRDVVCAPGQVLVEDNIILADTYRHLVRPRLQSKRLAEVAPLFASLRRDISNPVKADGPYFYWDSEFPGHFGHVLTEQVSKLWALDAARSRHPDLRVIFGRRWPDTLAQPFERAILEAVGFSEAEIHVFDRPTRVECLLAATPMLSMPEYVSPRLAQIWDSVGDAIAIGATTGTPRARVFCTRRAPKRSCRNSAEVEALFETRGFEIVLPEQMSMADQIQMFREADVIAGFAGSALFTMMFCLQPKRVIMICPESYTATNEYLISAVRGHAIDVFWSQPDTGSFQSSFAVDMEREGELLRDHLARLS